MPTAKKTASTTAAPAAKTAAKEKSAAVGEKQSTAKTAPAKKTTATKTAAKKPAEKKPAEKKPAEKKPAAKTEKPVEKKPAPKADKPAEQPAKTAEKAAKEPKKTSGKDADLPHLPGEQAWTAEEVAEVREELEADFARMSESIEQAEADLAELLQEGRDGAGLDPADVGSSNFERDQEMSLTANMRDTLEQTEHALNRLNTGRYGVCESCGEPIGKGRLLAFPRATMCVTCKTREERR